MCKDTDLIFEEIKLLSNWKVGVAITDLERHVKKFESLAPGTLVQIKPPAKVYSVETYQPMALSKEEYIKYLVTHYAAGSSYSIRIKQEELAFIGKSLTMFAKKALTQTLATTYLFVGWAYSFSDRLIVAVLLGGQKMHAVHPERILIIS